MKNKIKETASHICHVTTVHKRYDNRIFKKECISLAKEFPKITLIVNDDNDNEFINNVNIINLNVKFKNRIGRMFYSLFILKHKLIEVDADIYHFHDPELIPVANSLKKQGKKVVFDFHEDVPSLIQFKAWVYPPLRNLIAFIYKHYESRSIAKFDGVISVTPHIVERLKESNKNSILITNYPVIKEELTKHVFNDSLNICFAGGITSQWNHELIIECLEEVEFPIIYHLAGPVNGIYLNKLRNLKGWRKVKYYGTINQNEVREIYSKSQLGLALLIYETQVGKKGTLGNTKLFEYMEAGIPFVCSDNELWLTIVNEYNSGYAINPKNKEEFLSVLQELYRKKHLVTEKGTKGRKAAIEVFNWQNQEEKLRAFYNQLL